MSEFWLWFSTGMEHITDLNGYDHILFVTLLGISYTFASWKKLLVMITAFTLGHSISLALSVLANIDINTALIEFLIALSIFLTAVYSLWTGASTTLGQAQGNGSATGSKTTVIYVVVAIFGLIHGTGFSYLLKAMLGREESVAMPLLYFNLGLEAGQLAIVLVVLGMNVMISVLKVPHRIYTLSVVGLIGLIALKLCVERAMGLF